MQGLAFKTITSKYFKWSVTIITVIITCIIIYFISIEDKIIFPNLENYTYEYYTDLANGGNSQILNHVVSDSSIRLEFLLKEGFYSPYVGLSITPSTSEFIQVVKFNEIRLNISGQNINKVGIAFYMPPLNFNDYKSSDQALYHSYLSISTKPTTYSIAIKEFKHPEWWETLNQIPESKKNKPDLNHILHINIGSVFSPIIDNKKAIVIHSIVFTRNNKMLFLILGIIYMLSNLSLFGILYWKGVRKYKMSQINVSYKPLDISEAITGEEKSIEYINQNFQNSDLNLDLVAKETGIAQRKITNFISEKFHCNFKTYINKIRINEAKRLLNQSKLNIGEIAFKVGFNNQSHFNRVFKSEMGINPTEYRLNRD